MKRWIAWAGCSALHIGCRMDASTTRLPPMIWKRNTEKALRRNWRALWRLTLPVPSDHQL
eukprot:2394035-Pyramimonas_sp.AAC.1